MDKKNELSNLVPKLAAKLKDEIQEVEAKQEELTSTQETLQKEHTKIHHAQQEVKAEQSQLHNKRTELEYRLQEVRNEI